jgi:hypothetical protein
LPEESPGDKAEVHEFDHLLAAGQSIEISEPFIDVFDYIRDSTTAIYELKSTAVFHGWVSYQHVFSGSEVLKEPYCYVFTPQRHGLTGSPADLDLSKQQAFISDRLRVFPVVRNSNGASKHEEQRCLSHSRNTRFCSGTQLQM